MNFIERYRLAIILLLGVAFGFVIGFGIRGARVAGTAMAATRVVEFPDGSSLRYYQPAFRDVYVINRGNQTSIVSESATVYIRWTPEGFPPKRTGADR